MIRRLTALLCALLVWALPACAEVLAPDAEIPADWVVIDADTGVDKRFVHLATFVAPEGFSPNGYSMFDDGVSRDIYLLSDDPAAPVYALWVHGVAGMTATEFTDRLLEMLPLTTPESVTVEAGEPFEATVAGEAARCLYLRYSTPQGDYGCLYVAMGEGDVFVNILLSGEYAAPENVQTCEQLLAEAEVLLAGLTIVR